MENRGLLFIPDISGFTRFVNETEIQHSRLIIQELLEILINSNQIGLEVSEIEGDAILFYKFGEAPELKVLYNQVEQMFRAFHSNLVAYENRRFCQCTACMSAIHLTLKVITHFGEFTDYYVKHFRKLIGRDIIVAHQLLKNDIEHHEYWLVTENLLPNEPPRFSEWMRWNSSAKRIESGEIAFHYAQLGHLRNEIAPEISPKLDFSKRIKVLSLSKEYDTDIITLFHATGDFNYRSRWQEGVIRVEEVNHFLPRVGMRCRCILDDGQVIVYSSSYSYKPDRIEFSETDEVNKSVTCIILEKKSNRQTRLTLEFYIERNVIRQATFALTRKKKMEKKFQKSLLNLVSLAKEIQLPVEHDGLE